VVCLAVAVDQHQCPCRAKAAQVDVRRAFQAVRGELVGLAVNTRGRAKVADQFRNRWLAFQFQVARRQDVNREGRIFRRTLDE